MFAHERRKRIVDLLSLHRSMPVRTLEEELGISPATLRRDLAFLEKQDCVVRVHGGAVHPSETGETTFLQRSHVALEEKQRIAAAVAASVPKGSVVYIDSGTTCLEAGRLLRSREDLTILTNSLPLASGYEHFRSRLIVLGGEVRMVSGALVGDLSSAHSSQFRADIALIGASGLHPTEGAKTTELMERTAKRNWLLRATRKFLLADASKWELDPGVHFADWSEFDGFFTNARPPKAFRSPLKVTLV